MINNVNNDISDHIIFHHATLDLDLQLWHHLHLQQSVVALEMVLSHTFV